MCIVSACSQLLRLLLHGACSIFCLPTGVRWSTSISTLCCVSLLSLAHHGNSHGDCGRRLFLLFCWYVLLKLPVWRNSVRRFPLCGWIFRSWDSSTHTDARNNPFYSAGDEADGNQLVVGADPATDLNTSFVLTSGYLVRCRLRHRLLPTHATTLFPPPFTVIVKCSDRGALRNIDLRHTAQLCLGQQRCVPTAPLRPYKWIERLNSFVFAFWLALSARHRADCSGVDIAITCDAPL